MRPAGRHVHDLIAGRSRFGFIALAQARARAFDAITDPLMGWISDRTRSRWGRRRPYIVVGAPISVLSFVGLFAPPAHPASLEAAAWFTVMIIAFLYPITHDVHRAVLAGVDFHGIRVRASGQSGLVSDEDVQLHLDLSQRLSQSR